MTKQVQSKYKILYADDDDEDCELLEESFAAYPSHVEMICFGNGLEILSYLESLPPFDVTPCLIILDINMPLIDGKETLKRIRSNKRFADIPVILFTNSSELKDKQFAEQYNAGFTTKPFNMAQLKSMADMFINHCTDEVKKNIWENN